MVAMDIVFKVLTLLIAMFIVITLFFTVAKDLFPWLFPDSDINLIATQGTIELDCGYLTHTFTITGLGVAYNGNEDKNGFPVLIWGNKVRAPELQGGFLTLHPVDKGSNVYAFSVEIRMDTPPDGQGNEDLPGVVGQGSLVIAFFEKNEYCYELAKRHEERVIDGVTKYDTDYGDFVNQCSAKLKGLGILKTKPLLISCGDTIHIEETEQP